MNASVRHELERDRLGGYLGELEEYLGQPDPDLVTEFAELWRGT